ncbi:exported hypothetical protein [Ralstonia solanacearum K60]|nr:exported hypothetical protein [Ralstonia solanacearum K60]
MTTRSLRASLLVAPALSFVLASCAIERAQTAATAQTAMIGLTKGDVLACMGVPQAKADAFILARTTATPYSTIWYNLVTGYQQ